MYVSTVPGHEQSLFYNIVMIFLNIQYTEVSIIWGFARTTRYYRYANFAIHIHHQIGKRISRRRHMTSAENFSD